MRMPALVVALLCVPVMAAALTPERTPAASFAEDAGVAMPAILVGKWAPVCGSPEGERGGVTIQSNGRMDANDGSETCWIESLSRYERHLPPGRLGEWRMAGHCRDGKTQSEAGRPFAGVMWLQDLAGRQPRLYRAEGSCFHRGGRDCKHFASMSRCESRQLRSVSPFSP